MARHADILAAIRDKIAAQPSTPFDRARDTVPMSDAVRRIDAFLSDRRVAEQFALL